MTGDLYTIGAGQAGPEAPAPAGWPPAPANPPAPATPARRRLTLSIPLPTADETRRTFLYAGLAALIIRPRFHAPAGLKSLWPFGAAGATGPLHATLVYDADADDELSTAAAIKADATVPTQLAALKCAWRTFDKDSAELATLGLAKLAAGPFPVLVVEEEGKTKPAFAGHTDTAAAVVAKVKSLRGAN